MINKSFYLIKQLTRSGYIGVMIVNYRYKGLELYAIKGDRSKLHQSHIPKIRLILTGLDVPEHRRK